MGHGAFVKNSAAVPECKEMSQIRNKFFFKSEVISL